MCGIVGQAATTDIVRDTVDRLARLEYRGYDSYGVATVTADDISVTKAVGSIGRALKEGKLDAVPSGQAALAHTRWATHGGVSQPNAHPHLSSDGRVAVVHNGVIENHSQFRRTLEADGVTFASETDTEVVAQLLAHHLRDGLGMIEAIDRTLTELVGEYALGIIDVNEPGVVYGAKHKSPLLIAKTDGRSLLASDQMAVAGACEEVTYLEDGDVIRLTPGAVEIFSHADDGKLAAIDRPATSIGKSAQLADKNGFSHYMMKEIHDIPEVVRVALDIPADRFAGVLPLESDRRIGFVGSGSSYHVSLMGQYRMMALANTPAVAYQSDEAEFLVHPTAGDVLVAVSQSGETFDTLEVLRRAVAEGASVVSVSNVPGSTQERLADACFQQAAGPEICVLSTKSIVSQFAILTRLAVEHGRLNGTLSPEKYAEIYSSLERVPDTVDALISSTEQIQKVAKKYSHVGDWFFIGRGALYPLALESALKFKEVSYHHAEGMAAGFFKHGTISLIDEDFFTVALLPSKRTDPERFNATLSSVSEIAARSGPVIGIGPDDITADDLDNFVDYIRLPYHHEESADLILQLVAGQLLSYYCALDLGREIDQPRSLAKSVTVR